MKNTNQKKQNIICILLVMALMGFAVGFIGWLVYTKDARQIHSIVHQDFERNSGTDKKLIVSHELLRDMSVIPKSISLPYNYNELITQDLQENESQIAHILNSSEQDWDTLSWYADAEDYDYLAYPLDKSTKKIIECGYEEIGQTDNYQVYRRTKKERTSWLITQWGHDNTDQLMFYTFQNQQGNLIVVDGGWKHNAKTVRRIINRLGSHVDAWIITHPHPDHAGAFLEIYSNPGDITIDRVYAVDMASPALCRENASWDDLTTYNQWLTLDIPQLTYVYNKDKFEIAGLKFHVLSAYGDHVDELSNDLINDGSMMFKITAKRKSMLFCSDVGISMSDYILQDAATDLKADYIQMGHHGNGGLSHEFYQFVGAKTAFFDAPDWLMNDVNNQYTTPENRDLMISTGADVYHFNTAPNRFVLR